jgi:hypothetical protein
MLRTSTRRPIYSAHTRKLLLPSRRAVCLQNASEHMCHRATRQPQPITSCTYRSDLLPTTRPETHQNLIHTDKEHIHSPPGRSPIPSKQTTDRSIPTPARDLGTKGPNRLLLCDDTGSAQSARTELANSFYDPPPAQGGGGERVRTDDPLLAKQVLSQLSYAPILVGQGGFEPPTPRLSSVCSNQLSY